MYQAVLYSRISVSNDENDYYAGCVSCVYIGMTYDENPSQISNIFIHPSIHPAHAAHPSFHSPILYFLTFVCINRFSMPAVRSKISIYQRGKCNPPPPFAYDIFTHFLYDMRFLRTSSFANGIIHAHGLISVYLFHRLSIHSAVSIRFVKLIIPLSVIPLFVLDAFLFLYSRR